MIKLHEKMVRFKWLLLTMPPLFGIVLNIIIFSNIPDFHWSWFLLSAVVVMVFLVALSPIQITISNFMRSRQKDESGMILRLFLAFLIHLSVTAFVVLVIFLTYDWFHFFGYSFSGYGLIWGIMAGGIGNIVGIAVTEGIYSYHQWRETKLQAEQLSKEKLQTQLNVLLQQINPHFLFNSLNALSALINENPKDAQKYLSDLSKVYRYLLQTNENELTTLTSELNFNDSYFHLLQTRFGKGVVLLKHIHPDDVNMLLPPLTLQLLVENAVKHNTVGKNKPLTIEIISGGDYVLVRNNLQRKSLKVESGKVGLSNIAEKYRLINKSSIDISEDGEYFVVKVPLIYPGNNQ